MIRMSAAPLEQTSAEGGMMPMVDVIFSLIAFMMLIINAPQLSMELNLPEAGAALQQPVESESLTLTIIAEQALWQLQGGERLNDIELKQALSEQVAHSTQPPLILLEVDRQAPTQRVVETLELLAELKLSDVRMMLDAPAGAVGSP